MQQIKHIFIMNPAAGKGNAEKEILHKLIEISKKTGIPYEIHRTIGIGDATRFVKGRCERNFHLAESERLILRFYACGGDGTLNEVVNGIFGYRDVEVTVIPAGTGNDFLRNFGDKKDFLDINRQIFGQPKAVDVIQYEMDGAVKYGINMLNIGLDCIVASKAAELKKYPLISGSLAYGLGIGQSLIKKDGVEVAIELGEEGMRFDGYFMLIAMANGSYYGGGFKAAPYAKVDDGLIDVSIVQDMTRRTLITLLGKYRKGAHLEDSVCKELITYNKCKSLSIIHQTGMQISIDGEITTAKEIKLQIVPKAINFSVPQTCE